MPELARVIIPDANDEEEEYKKENEYKNEDDEELNEDLEIAKRPTIGEEMYDSGDDDDEFFDRTKKTKAESREAKKLTKTDLLKKKEEINLKKKKIFYLRFIKVKLVKLPIQLMKLK